MKKILTLLLAFPLAATFLTGCQPENIVYSGPEYVMFSDTIYTMPVLDEEDATFSVPVTATTTADYDRNYAVEIINDKSTAVRGRHFDFVDNTNNVVIKAGERVANVVLKGHYNNVGRDDSLRLSLRLVEPSSQKWDLYGDVTKVDFVKCHPFEINEFLKIKNDAAEANFIMYATFPFGNDMNTFQVKGFKKDDKTLMLTDMFGTSGSDNIRVIFDDSDPLDLVITVPEQPGFRESTYGTVWIRSIAQYPSYFNTFDNFFVLLLEAYVPQIGSFGVYQYIFKAIDADEAENGNNGAVTRSAKSTTFSLNKFNFKN